MRTYYGTFTDINESDIFCLFGEYKLYFTSKCTKDKFLKNVDEYCYIEELKIKNKYNIDIDLKNYLGISYYKSIQKKGFRVERVGDNKLINNFDFRV